MIFTQLNAEVNDYRDAVRLVDECRLRLQDLREGMRVEILSLSGVHDYVPVMMESIR